MGKQNNKNTKYIIIVIVIIMLFLSNAIGSNEEQTNETVEITSNKATIQETATEQITELETTTAKKIKTTTKKKKISKKEYKKQCIKLYNDDVFSEYFIYKYKGKNVKIDVMFSEKYNFKNDYSIYLLNEDFIKENNISEDFWGCCVKHKNSDSIIDSYFGEQIFVFFTNNSKPYFENYDFGDKATLYGEVLNGDYINGILVKYIEIN